MARNLLPVGGRHDYALALAGYLLRPGRLDAERTFKLMMTAWSTADDVDQEAFRDVDASVRDTIRNLASGGQVIGGPTLEEIAPGVPALLARYYGWDERVRVEVYERPLNLPSEAAPWPVLGDAALYGLAGEIVSAVDPHTEADPVAVLVSLLAAFGGACGRGAHVRVGADAHYLNVFAALVGETSKGRKGTSWGCVRDLMRTADGAWADERIVNGLSSGEGLIHAVRDATVRRDKKDGERVEDEGVTDKRLLVLEPELAATLKVASRQGNIVTAVIRQAFDGEKLQTLTRNNPQKATGAHVSMIGHITRGELLRYLTETEAANGFANRFLWIMVRRSKQLPFGGRWDEVDTAALVGRLKTALAFGSSHKEVSWGDDAKEIWVKVYGPLSEGGQGLLGAVTGRAEAQVVRLAALYAVMDCSREIGAGHLRAALALWDYAEDSARYVFGDAIGDPVADRIYDALKAAPEGMTRTQVSNLFKRHKDAAEIDRALETLLTSGRARRKTEATGGRSTERWFAKNR